MRLNRAPERTALLESLLLRNGRIVDPGKGISGMQDLRIEQGRIVGIGPDLPGSALVEIDLRGAAILPGLFDLHVDLREPGGEDAETVETGARAAARGGFTGLACMPGTPVPIDTRAVLDLLRERESVACGTRIHPVCALTRGMEGQRLTEMWELADAGAVAASDADAPTVSSEVLRRAMEYATMCGLPVFAQGEDHALRGRGVMHEGFWSTTLGLRGIPAAAEEIGIARNLSLARITGARLHVQRVSTRAGVELIRRAKESGLAVTAETAPHYLGLTDEALRDYRSCFKVSPPLRPADDCAAVRAAVRDGTIDVLVSDHAPHTTVAKDVEFDQAPFGVVGLETAFGVAYRELVAREGMPLEDLVERFSGAPRRVIGLPAVRVATGEVADLTVIRLDSPWTVTPTQFATLGRSTPFEGWELPVSVELTITQGRITHQRTMDTHLQARNGELALPRG